MDKMQPIETAPKDGTQILLYGLWSEPSSGRSDLGPFFGVGSYISDKELLHSAGKGRWVDAIAYYDMYCDATHWAPLPEVADVEGDRVK